VNLELLLHLIIDQKINLDELFLPNLIEKKMKLMISDFFYAMIHRYVFDVSNEVHIIIIKFILIDLLILPLVIDLIICFLTVRFEVKQVIT
jgi:hypothetical protein